MSRWRRWLVGAGMAAGGPLSVLAANGWVRRRARPYLFEDDATAPERSVAIVPGARVQADGEPSPILGDRLDAARRLYHAGKVRRILVSGARDDRGYDEPAAMRRWLTARGVPAEAVIGDDGGVRTFETMARAAQLFGIPDAVVCTQRFHLARSVYLARAHGIDAVGLVSDARRYRKRLSNDAREALARARAVANVLADRR